MASITNIWLCNLQPGYSIADPTFVELWNETFHLITSYTDIKPSARTKEQHVLFQSETDSGQLVFITGYPSLQSNREADSVYAATIMKRMGGIVQHQRLMMLDKDIDELPLHSGRITLSLMKPELAGREAGGWDVWQPPGCEEPILQKTWVHVSAADTTEQATDADSSWVLTRIMGR